jgi:putative sterol carrier protein
VARYLSDEWMAAARSAIGRGEPARDGARETLVVQHTITGAPDGDRSFHITVDDGALDLRPGAAPAPDVTFTQDYATAFAIAGGQLSAQAAFMSGDLRVGGDLSLLVASQRAFEGLDDLLASVRASTTYE